MASGSKQASQQRERTLEDIMRELQEAEKTARRLREEYNLAKLAELKELELRALDPEKSHLLPIEYERYSRQLVLPSVGARGNTTNSTPLSHLRSRSMAGLCAESLCGQARPASTTRRS